MQILSFDSADNLFDEITSKLFELESDEYISVYCKRNLLDKLFTTLISDGFKVKYVDYDMIDDFLEDTIYLLTIFEDASVGIEVAYAYTELKKTDATVSFISMDDCDQSLINKNLVENREVILFDFQTEEEFDDCCNDDDLSFCEDCCDCGSIKSESAETSESNIPGFTYSFSNDKGYTSVSFYSSDKKLVNRMAELYMK